MKNYYYLFVLSSFIKDRVGGSGGRVQGEDAGYKMWDLRYVRSQKPGGEEEREIEKKGSNPGPLRMENLHTTKK